MKKKLLSYEKNRYEEFLNKISDIGGNVYPISYLADEKVTLKYTSINNVDKFVIDITTMVLSAQIRVDLRIIYESWINALNEENEENILFCIEKQYLRDACQLFSYYFEAEDEEIEVIQKNEKEGNNIQESDSNIEKSIVNYNKMEFDYVIAGINKNLYGHEAFKKDLEAQLQSFILLHKMGRKKLFSTLICGKSGIGKTEVGRVLQKLMYPKELPIKINFGNYSGKGSLWSLIGSPKGYVGSEQGGELTNKIIKSKSKIIVIDELDKADDAIYTFFYEMLEDGQYTDLDGNLIDLDGYIVIFTANLSNKNFKDKIPEPLFSRFDMTYEFQPLTQEEITQYIAEYVDELIRDYSKVVRDFDIEKVRSQILNRDYSACDNLRIIKKNVMNDFVREVSDYGIWDETEN